jgi:uncharacterized protein (TIGR02466 family)
MDRDKPKSAIYPLFATPLMYSGEQYKINVNELEYIKSLKTRSPYNKENKRTKSSDVLESLELSTLKQFCLKWISFYAHEFLTITKSTEFYITQSWCNFASKGDMHKAHMHSNSLISGVFYIRGENTPLVFHREKDMFALKFNYDKWDMNNCEAYVMEMEAGKLFIFPSSIKHSVFENDTDTERISLAFNTWASGEFGIEENSNWLKLG